MDKTDKILLGILQRDSRIPLQEIAKKLGVSKSTTHYRIGKFEREKIIEGYHAKLNAAKLGYEYLAVVLVKAKYGSQYHKKVGTKLSKIAGVWAVYYVLGDYDFIVLMRAINRDDYMEELERLSNMPDIERIDTQIVGRVVKEDPRILA